MKHAVAAAAVLALPVIFAACRMQFTDNTTTEAPQGTSVIEHIEESATAVYDETTTQEELTSADETSVQTAATETVSQTTTGAAAASSQVTSAATTTRKTEYATTVLSSEVDLSITLPEKNGTMMVDKASSNKFISAIVSQRKLDADYLVAVYSVPESGQNYVFEFSSEDFTTDTLRRVYLLDSSCKITGVAATNASEREKLSSTENWFCMNVLIKGVIFPEIEDRF